MVILGGWVFLMSEVPLYLTAATTFHVKSTALPAGVVSQLPGLGPCFTEMCRGPEAGSYLRLIGSCITQLKAQ